MSEGGAHIFWCKACRKVLQPAVGEEEQKREKEHRDLHKNSIVGIRHDLFIDGMVRMVWELGVQGRLLLANPGK